ncbi:MAG: phosphatase PAP2 family protein [Thermomicrobiales bacterium]
MKLTKGDNTTDMNLRPRNWMPGINRLFIAMVFPILFALPLSVLAAGDNVLEPDVAVTHEVQEVNAPGTSPVVSFLNELGSITGLVAVSVAVAGTLYFAGRRRDAVFALIPVTAAQLANLTLKYMFSSPRPTTDLVTVTDPSRGFGFPSGHTMTTVVVAGSIAFLVLRGVDCRWRRALVMGTAAVVALGMGFSRIYVGAHWPSDVLGAYLWGTAFTALIILAYQTNRLHPSSLFAR